MAQTAPTLPKGYFFRVRGCNGWVYCIELRRRLWKFSYRLGYSVCDSDMSIHEIMSGLQSKYLPHTLGDDSVYGEYPPKTTIGGSN